jgi:hypothetical protein
MGQRKGTGKKKLYAQASIHKKQQGFFFHFTSLLLSLHTLYNKQQSHAQITRLIDSRQSCGLTYES